MQSQKCRVRNAELKMWSQKCRVEMVGEVGNVESEMKSKSWKRNQKGKLKGKVERES